MSDDIREIKWFNPFDRKMHTVRIDNGTDEGLDIHEVLDSMDEVAKSKEEECKRIYFLGVAVTGSVGGGRGFLDGWLMRSLRDTYETKSGKWSILHDTEQLSNEELRSHFVRMLRDAADRIETEDDFDPKNAPVVKRDDGTELFD